MLIYDMKRIMIMKRNCFWELRWNENSFNWNNSNFVDNDLNKIKLLSFMEIIIKIWLILLDQLAIYAVKSLA